MKEFNKLLEYRQYYKFDRKEEEINIGDGPLHTDAQELYFRLLQNFFPTETGKFIFDVAIACIHDFTEEDIQAIRQQGTISNYYFGYGMYVRNHYIHTSKKHNSFWADGISVSVEETIYTIIHPVYNRFSREFMALLDDWTFKSIKPRYESTQPVINNVLEILAQPDNETSATDALKIIIGVIRKNLGPNGFINTILPDVRDHISKYKYIRNNWDELTEKLYNSACVYRKEYYQFRAIKEMSIFNLVPGSLKTVEEAQSYIIENLGLSEVDALHMAKCAFAVAEVHKEFCNNQ